MGIVGMIVLVGSFALVAALFTYPVPNANRDMITMSSGVILGWGGAIVSFYFGSSKSSRDKDERAAQV